MSVHPLTEKHTAVVRDTEHRGQVVTASYPGVAGFKSQGILSQVFVHSSVPPGKFRVSPQIKPRPLPFKSFSIHYPPNIVSLVAMQYELLPAVFHKGLKPQINK
jgi:hypothetical protein